MLPGTLPSPSSHFLTFQVIAGTIPSMPYTEDDLHLAISVSSFWEEVFQHLGVRAGNAKSRVRIEALRLGYSLRVFVERRAEAAKLAKASRIAHVPRRAYTDEQLSAAMEASTSWAEVCLLLGRAGNATRQRMRNRATKLGYARDYFIVKRLDRGIERRGRKLSTRALVRESGTRTTSEGLRRTLDRAGRPHTCALCGNDGTWLGKRMRLDIDHVNGNPLDDRPENLRYLCPNCHRCETHKL